jgi:hypothetical protein
MYAGTVDGIYKSSDAGVTWTKLKGVVAGETLLAISPGFDNDHTIFAGTAGGLLVSNDAGATWTAAPLPSTPVSTVEAVALSPDFSSDHTLLASVGGVGLFKSTDAGKTFTAVGADLLEQNLVISDFTNPTGAAIQFSPAFARDHTIFAYAEQDVVRSTDGGATWTVLPIPSALSFLRSDAPDLLKRYGETTPAHDSNTTVVIIVAIAVVVVVLGGVFFFVRSRRRARITAKAAPKTTT